jgi:hypothetical protein
MAMNTINPQLKTWLNKNAVFQGHVRVVPSDDAIFIAALAECRAEGLLGKGSMHNDSEGEYIDYPLTGFGRDIVLGIPATEAPPPAAPVASTRFADTIKAIYAEHGVPDFAAFEDDSIPDSGATDGTTYTWDENGVVYRRTRMFDSEAVVTMKPIFNNVECAIECASVLTTETAALRSQVAALTGENNRLQESIGHLGKTIDEAGYYLGQASDKDENSNRAYSILKGYSVAD